MLAAFTASIASITLPGPIGRPAARKVRAKRRMFWASRLVAAIALVLKQLGGLLGGEIGAHLFQDRGGLGTADPRDVVLVLQQRAEAAVDRTAAERHLVELHQGVGPVDGLGDARQFEEITLPELLHEGDDFLREIEASRR